MQSSQLANEATGRLAVLTQHALHELVLGNWPDLTRPRLAGFDLSTELGERQRHRRLAVALPVAAITMRTRAVHLRREPKARSEPWGKLRSTASGHVPEPVAAQAQNQGHTSTAQIHQPWAGRNADTDVRSVWYQFTNSTRLQMPIFA